MSAAPASLRVGNLPTLNQDDYPSLGAWWLNIWQGEGDDAVVIARAYGDTPEQARDRANAIVAAIAEVGEEPDDGACPACGEDGGTSCGMPNCGLLSQERDA